MTPVPPAPNPGCLPWLLFLAGFVPVVLVTEWLFRYAQLAMWPDWALSAIYYGTPAVYVLTAYLVHQDMHTRRFWKAEAERKRVREAVRAELEAERAREAAKPEA